MKRKMTETDRLAAKMGHRIRRKRDGRFELIRKNCNVGMVVTTIDAIKHYLKVEWEKGWTITTACGMPLFTVPPAKVRSVEPGAQRDVRVTR